MDWKRKLTSRKFWAAVVNFVTQLLLAFRLDENEVAQIAAIIMAGAGVVAYIIGEGMADAGATNFTVVPPPEIPASEETEE